MAQMGAGFKALEGLQVLQGFGVVFLCFWQTAIKTGQKMQQEGRKVGKKIFSEKNTQNFPVPVKGGGA